MAASVTARRRKPGRSRPPVVSTVVLLACAVYFILPLLAMARFAFQQVPMVKFNFSTLFDRWSLDSLSNAFSDPLFKSALMLSLKLAVGAILVTLGILLPTALWVHLRVPKARPLVEILTVLPYVVPPIALVVGVAGTFRETAPWFLSSELSLIPFYSVLAMPFTYRALDAGIRAIDLRTLVDASRSLGAGWLTTLFRVLIPNLTSAIVGSAFLTATVVLGEFTIASLLLKRTLPTYLVLYQNQEPQGGMALALVVFVATALLLALFIAVTRRSGRGGSLAYDATYGG
jgi:putative spermidine/putrescine transport system permease protein